MAVGRGVSLLPWRGQSWGGQQSLSASDHGERQFLKIVGGYIGGYGREIRTIPGWKCIVNPIDGEVGEDGYRSYVIDSQRPVAGPKGPADSLRERVPYSVVAGSYGAAANASVAFTDTQMVWAELKHLHSFHFIRNKLVIIGETGIRIEPILDSATRSVRSKMSSWSRNGSGQAVVALSPSPGAVATNTPNQVQAGDVLWIDSVVDANAADAARLSRRAHFVLSVAIPNVTLLTTVAAASTGAAIGAEVGRCRGNLSASLSVNGRSAYGESFENALLDEDSLTAFWVDTVFDIDLDPVQKVYPSYVANRIRDYADHGSPHRAGLALVEGYRPYNVGHWSGVGGSEHAGIQEHFGIPRRRTMRLPFRTVPQISGDRIILAAPGYGCMFQVPGNIPSAADAIEIPGKGVVVSYNSPWSRPRSLGVPKGVLVVPNVDYTYYLARGIAASTGFALGKYRLAVAYRDEATGEIGQLSEEWIADNQTGLAFKGTCRAGSTTTVIAVNEALSAGAWVGFELYISGNHRTVTANTGGGAGTCTITVGAAFGAAPADTTPYEVRGASLSISIGIQHPGYVLAETAAFSCMIFMSKVGEESLNHVATIQLQDSYSQAFLGGVYQSGASTSSVYGLEVLAEQSGFAVDMFFFYTIPTAVKTVPELLNPDIEIPVERTMPRGASWCRVVRGVRVSGGSLGDSGQRLEMQSGTATLTYGGPTDNANQRKELTIRRCDKRLGTLDIWPMVGNRTIPSSYGGCSVWSPTMFPHPMERVTLDRLANSHANYPEVSSQSIADAVDIRHQVKWSVVENPHRWDGTRSVLGAQAYIVLPRGQVQIGEPGLPGVQIGFGVGVVDANKDEDTVAAGEFRGLLLMMTQRHTYSMSWDQGPAGSLPILQSNEFGCIAPATVVEHDAATCWISETGPVEFRQEIMRSGFFLERDFRGATARFLRDSQGMMRHAWAYYDDTRDLVFIGLLENRSGNLSILWEDVSRSWNAATDGVRSRFPCDTVIIYNPTTGAWSEWWPPAGLEILWMGPVTFKDGRQRTAFLAQDGRIYALDDLFGCDNAEPLTVIATASGTATTTVAVSSSIAEADPIGTANTNRGGLGSFIRAGAKVCIYDPSTFELKHVATLVSGSAGSIVLDTPGTWAANDVVAIGCRTMTLQTTYTAPKGGDPTTVVAVTLFANVSSRIESSGIGTTKLPAWAKASIAHATHQSGRHGGGVDARRSSTMHANQFGDLIGASDVSRTQRNVRLSRGTAEGKSFTVQVEVFGPAQVALQDIQLEVS